MSSGQRVVIGIGGKIGTGKTTVAKIFRDLGAQYISADEIGWEVLPEITDVLQNELGKGIMLGAKIDKRKLRELVFTDAQKLEFLNRVSHPILTRRIIERVREIKSGVVVIDAALLFDWPEVYETVDFSILLTARRELMLERAKAKGMSSGLFMQIMEQQKSEQEMKELASYLIENNGTIAELREKCKVIYKEISHDC
ncbi:MAG: dephospho-CoA kinase [candidate division WOR-3 bacterium]|jgi:dephospho-CoA kinase